MYSNLSTFFHAQAFNQFSPSFLSCTFDWWNRVTGKPTKEKDKEKDDDDDDDDDDASKQANKQTNKQTISDTVWHESLNELEACVVMVSMIAGSFPSRTSPMPSLPGWLLSGRPGERAKSPRCQTATTTIWNPFFKLRTADFFRKIGRSLLSLSGLPVPTSTVPLCFTASGRHWLQLQGSLKLRKVARSTFLVTRCD